MPKTEYGPNMVFSHRSVKWLMGTHLFSVGTYTEPGGSRRAGKGAATGDGCAGEGEACPGS